MHRVGEVARNRQRVGGNGRDEKWRGAGGRDQGDVTDAGDRRKICQVAAHNNRCNDGCSAVEWNQCC